MQIQNIVAALELYQLDVGRYPTEQEGLDALVTPPAERGRLERALSEAALGADRPLGQPYLYRNPGKHGEMDVYSLGSDQAEGGTGEAADVGNW